MDDYYYYDAGAAIAAMMFTVFITLLFAVVGYVLSSIFLKKIFEKAGVQNPNLAWVPIYNGMLFSKLADINPWVYLLGMVGGALLSSIPIIGWIIALAPLAITIALAPLAITIALVYRINVKFSKGPVGWTIFGVLLSIIWLGVLGYGTTAPWRTGEQVLARPFWHKWGTFFQDSTTFGGVPFQGYPVVAQQPPAAPPAAPPAPPAA